MSTDFQTAKLALSLLAFTALSSVSAQVTLPPINIGNTNFMDGRALPGTMFQQTIIAADANSFNDNNGDTQPAPDALRTVGIATQLAWLSDRKLFGANWGAEFILPLVHVDVDLLPGVSSRKGGLGDLFLSPLVLQWPEKELLGRPFWQRFNFNVTVPVGEYDRNRPANIGTNSFRINPHYAATWMFADRWEVSARFHYLWNGKNDDPSPGLGADWTRAGEAVHTNLAISREIAPGLRFGLAGYHLRQISDDEIDSVKLPDSREQVIGFGPGIRFQRGPQVLFVHAYHETAVRNRPKRNQVIVRYARFF
jgi:hypothetical protein